MAITNIRQAILYLEHYSNLSSFAARNAHIVDIELQSITLSSGKQKYRVAVDPPMKTLKEARERLVFMDQEARRALGRNNFSVKEYWGPSKLYEILTFFICIFTFIVLSREKNLKPGSLLYDLLLKRSHTLNDLLIKFQWIFWPMTSVHIAETVFMITQKLHKHTVPAGSLLWWKWVLSTLIDGIFTFRRFEFSR